MKYVTGMVTGALVGAVMAGVWLLRKTDSGSVYRLAWRQARHMTPKAWRAAKVGGRELFHMAKRRLS
ncbi:MAG: hypothetical protein M1294_09285 [Firmicutes bacterium]|jgi:hypothetical protein|nr:hypothetical protein [Bacillota bacterium]MCL5014045.1 hypothetical protein [Bacillota bacterium]